MIGGGGYGLGGPVPRDLWILLGTVFFTFSLQFFSATAGLVAALRLSPQLWRAGWIWQPFTYPFAGSGAPSFWLVWLENISVWGLVDSWAELFFSCFLPVL